MTVFAIILAEPTTDDWEKLKTSFAQFHYIIDDRLALVSGKNYDLTGTIAEKLGMNEKQEVAGIVISMDWYNGYHDGAIWEWLAKKRKEQ